MRVGSYESDRSSVGTAITFLMVGIGVGALTALLLAPKTGKQLRRDLRRRFDDARDTLESGVRSRVLEEPNCLKTLCTQRLGTFGTQPIETDAVTVEAVRASISDS